jgi:SAM-dependent methyltransferase
MSDITKIVKERYGKAALQVLNGTSASCCSPSSQASSCCGASPLVPGAVDPVTANLYDAQQTGGLPPEAVLASLGCGNPTALATLLPGEVVLDLGSGGGIDVLLSARRVGPSGKAYGLDMTDEMLALARENQRKSGLENVEFLKGQIEDIPLPGGSVDVIISNCVINLSADKDRVLAEAYRVLKPGGRLAVSDVVVRGEIPSQIRRSVELWVGCISGALDESDYLDKLDRAGFVDASIEPTRVYRAGDAREFLNAQGIDVDTIAPLVDNKFYSGFIRATKPGR